jgi:serine/threonine-protein kinase RIO1
MLYQSGRVVLIDFPQVVDASNNPRARAIFARDIKQVVQYFGRSGVSVDPAQLAQELWANHVPEPEDMEHGW